MYRFAINGYGRIGRSILRAVFESPALMKQIKIVAVNHLSPLETAAHLTRYDSTHGRFQGTVVVDDKKKGLVINGHFIQFVSHADPADSPWKALKIDVACECTGRFLSRAKAEKHLHAGAQKVLISAPSDGEVDSTIVYGVNHQLLKHSDRVVSAASCTTNCLAPVVKIMHQKIGFEHGFLTTIHSYTGDQVLVDATHKDLRRARAAATSMIPTKTGAAKAVGLVLPELIGKLHGYAVRVPTLNVSMIDLNFVSTHETTVEEVNEVFQEAARGQMSGVLAYSDELLVSSDFNHTTASSTIDGTLTQVMEKKLIKVVSWYDNEWGFAHRMLDLAKAMADK